MFASVTFGNAVSGMWTPPFCRASVRFEPKVGFVSRLYASTHIGRIRPLIPPTANHPPYDTIDERAPKAKFLGKRLFLWRKFRRIE
jgi:hypothetical protein